MHTPPHHHRRGSLPTTRHVLVALAVAAGAVLVAPGPPAGAGIPISPTITADLTDPNDGELSLREVFDLAGTAATDVDIIIPPGTYELTRCGPPEDLNVTGDLDLSVAASVSISGPATVVNTCGDDGVLDVSSLNAITLDGLVLTGGESDHPDRGPVAVTAHDTQLHDVTVTNNTNHTHGGAVTINSRGGAIDVSDSTITGNTGGGLVAWWNVTGTSSPPSAQSDFELLDTTVSSNTNENLTSSTFTTMYDNAIGSFGGVMVLGADDVAIRDSHIIDNRLDDTSGTGFTGLLPVGGASLLFVKDSEITRTEFLDNSGGIGGLGVASSSGWIPEQTSLSEIDVSDSEFRDNAALADSAFSAGGGLFLGGELDVAHTLVTSNTAAATSGVTLGQTGGLMGVSLGDTTIDGSTVVGNSGGIGGLFLWANSADPFHGIPGAALSMTDSVVTQNVGTDADSVGGAWIVAEHVAAADVTVTHNSGAALGGLAVNANANALLERLVVTDNVGTRPDDGLGGAHLLAFHELRLEDATVARNTAPGVGGARVGSTDFRAYVTRSTFFRNVATGTDGVGALDGFRGDVRLSAATITNNDGPRVGGVHLTDEADRLGLFSSTITWNTDNVEVSGSAPTDAWGTVVSTPKPGTLACVGVVHAAGDANYDTDGSCGWTGPNDVSDGPNPLLAPLRDNGGFVKTRRPDNNSPLRNAIPAASFVCSGAGLAANGVARPLGGACEIGAMERN